jgi:hypothetical protein
VNITKTERRLLTLAPERFAALILMDRPRPWSRADVRECGRVLAGLPAHEWDELRGFGLMLQRALGVGEDSHLD